MARRSLKASTAGIEIAKKAFKMKEWTQEYLASEVGLETRQPIWKFFTGKPIERQTFMEICFQLGLDWQEIAEIPTQSLQRATKQDWNYCRYIDSLVQMVRSRRSDKIQAQCATTRLLDIAQPTELEDIYVGVNVLNYITSQRWLDLHDLQSLVGEEFDRFVLNQSQERIGGMQAVAIYPKLLVLGKPGSGKTTFLQYIAMQCDRGKFLADRIPIFIRLKNFAEDARETGNFSLLNYISQDVANYGVSDQQIQILLTHGRVLFLLDGLDEISEDDSAEIVKNICKLSEEYYKNHFILTCRVAAWQHNFEGFTDIEIADFDSSQIETFVQKWFVNVGRNSREQGKALATQFVQKLHKSENSQIRELATTPLLLNLVCCVFQARSDFPARATEYQQALDVLLDRWDRVRRIKRHEDCSYLSLPHKLNLLSYIAAITFEQERYFFTQSSILQYITDYLRNLSATEATFEVLQLNSEAVLKSLEVRGILVERSRGIYSFSHLIFQEYLTARNIARFQPQKLEEKLLEGVSHLTEPRWRKVFLLAASMLVNPADLLQLMKQHIDALVNFDRQLQQFLIWLNQKSLAVQTPYKSAAIRAFYLKLAVFDDLTLPDEFSFAIDPQFDSNLTPDLALDRDLSRALQLSLDLPCNLVERLLTLSSALPHDRTVDCNPELQRSLQQLKKRLPAPRDIEKLEKWWNTNDSQTWAENLRSVMLRYRNIGDRWQLSEEQKQVLRQYYTANQILVDCLNICYEITPTVREKILGTLLLPIATSSNCASDERGRDGYIEYCA